MSRFIEVVDRDGAHRCINIDRINDICEMGKACCIYVSDGTCVSLKTSYDEILKVIKDNFPFTSIVEDVDINKGRWEFWPGWIGNHDKRIEDATCSRCGYVHPTVRRELVNGRVKSDETAQDILNKLATICPGCGRDMEVTY